MAKCPELRKVTRIVKVRVFEIVRWERRLGRSEGRMEREGRGPGHLQLLILLLLPLVRVGGVRLQTTTVSGL